MEYIRIFLASSIIRFHNERLEIADCIRALNDRYVEKGIYFRLFICEDESEMISMTRKQDEYNEEIKSSDYFYMFVGDSLGRYTMEEFDTALDEFRKKQSPRIYTYFYQAESAGQFFHSFMEKLDQELGHYYSIFTNIDSVKLHMLMELISDPRTGGRARVEFKDGAASVDDVPVMSLSRVPAFSRNKALQENIRQLKKLDEEFAGLAIEFGKSPQDLTLLGKLSENARKRGELEKQIHDAEKLLFDLMKMTCDRTEEGSWRVQQALREIEAGNYEGALYILRDAQRTKELENAQERILQAEEIRRSAIMDIENFIEENLLRIRTIELSGTGKERYNEIRQIYEQNLELYRKHKAGKESVLRYLQFLIDHNQNSKAIRIISEIMEMAPGGDPEDPEFKANVLNKRGYALIAMNKLKMAKESIGEALAVISRVNGDISTRLQVEINLNYGSVLFALNEYEGALAYHLAALALQEQTGCETTESIDKKTEICVSLGSLYSDLNKRAEAEEYYIKARDCLSQMTDLSQNEIKNKAVLLNNLAILSVQKNDITSAEEYIASAIETVEKGMEKDPAAFLPYRTMVLLNRGMILFRSGDSPGAAKDLEYVLQTREMLSEKEPETFKALIATACHNLGVITGAGGEERGAAYFERAETLEQELMETHSDIFKIFSVISHMTRIALYEGRSMKRMEECISLCRQLVEEISPAYKSYLGMAYLNAGLTAHRLGDDIQAAAHVQKSKELYEEISAFTGEKNQETSYKDVVDYINEFLEILRHDREGDVQGIWYIELYEIWNGQITGIAVRAKDLKAGTV